MHDDILFMHDDVPPCADRRREWDAYLATLRAAGTVEIRELPRDDSERA
jgi:hypothetical protein